MPAFVGPYAPSYYNNQPIFGSSQTNPSYANFQGSQTYAPKSVPQTSQYLQNPNNQVAPTINAPTGSSSVIGGKNYSGWSQQAISQDQASIADQQRRFEEAQRANSERESQLRGDISSGWDNYLGTLGTMNIGLDGQRTAQEGIANNQYIQGVNQLDLSKQQGVRLFDENRSDVNANQVKNLRDLAGNVKNSMMAGNIYLGAKGAGDSSAANQYSYALTKEGTRQRTDVMNKTSDILNDIDGREANLNDQYNTGIENLRLEKDSKINEVATWFYNAQNSIKQAIASGQLGKSQDLNSLSKDLLNQGIAAVNQINAEISNKRSGLESWAMSNSKNIQELRTNMQGVSQFTPNMPQAGQVAGQPQVDSQGNFRVQTGYGGGSTDDQRNTLFKNPAWR